MAGKVFHIQPWTPRVRQTADEIIRRIHAVAPDLEVLFMGAAALKLPGKNDIDLDILCSQADIGTYTKILAKVLGSPKGTEDNLTMWEFMLDGFEVDAILSDPKTSHVPLQRKRFEVLKANPTLLNEYKVLKEASDGLPYKEYEKRKLDFFEERVFSSKAEIKASK